jgi:hypothetical protein
MPNYSLAVNGSGQNALFPFPAIATGTDWALSFWAKMLNTSGGFVMVLDDASTLYRMIFDYTGTNTGFIGGMMSGAAVGNLPNDDNWHHLVVTRSGTTQTFYIDGSSANAAFNSTAASAINVHFGDVPSSGGSNPFSGKYADIRVYVGSGLSSTDVTTLYTGGNVTANMVRHWALTEGTGTPTDTSGFSQDGNLNTATWDTDVPTPLAPAGATATPGAASLALATFAPTVTATTATLDVLTVGVLTRRRRRRTLQIANR